MGDNASGITYAISDASLKTMAETTAGMLAFLTHAVTLAAKDAADARAMQLAEAREQSDREERRNREAHAQAAAQRREEREHEAHMATLRQV